MKVSSRSYPFGGAKSDAPLNKIAFTLVEVLLAIAIATGLLLVAILFFQQAAELRSQIQGKADRYAQVRLVLDRLVADLRTARPRPGESDAFAGNNSAIRLVRVAWTGPIPGAGAQPRTGGADLMRINLQADQDLEGTNLVVKGISRSEEPLGVRPRSSKPADGSLVLTNPAISTNTTRPASGLSLEPRTQRRRSDLLSDAIRFVQFRYWDGAAWVDGWTNSSPPSGVELTLSCDPPMEGTNRDEYSSELFRRVVFIPGAEASRKQETNEAGLPNPL